MKIAVIGAGNVGGLTAMRIAESGLADVTLLDIKKGLALGKASDLEDARPIISHSRKIIGEERLEAVKGSSIVIICAGTARKPGMKREDLLKTNVQIVKEISKKLKRILKKNTIIIVVANPLDLMTYLVLKSTGWERRKVLGMGASLDSARFANLLSKRLKVSPEDINALVIGTHNNKMLVLPRYTFVEKRRLTQILSKSRIDYLARRTSHRGAEIVSLLKEASASFAPSAAICELVKSILLDEKKTYPVSCYLNGEYGLNDLCIGVPVRLGKNGIEQIIELNLEEKEKKIFYCSAKTLQDNIKRLKLKDV